MHELLIVDGGEELANALAACLGYEGFNAVAAKNEQDAVDRIEHGPNLPEAVLIDMDRRHESAVLAALTTSPERLGVPVVVVSDLEPQQVRGLDRAQYAFRKPVSLQTLVEVLRQHCRRSA